ncbi:MAG: hypothetical protein ICV69_14795 [Thermoleophilaceae bacterium]|nr:hypothetical protein [Thermoleophilaceae bacterium]
MELPRQRRGAGQEGWRRQRLQALPSENITIDIHLLAPLVETRRGRGRFSVDRLLAEADKPYALALCDGGYATSLAIDDTTGSKA